MSQTPERHTAAPFDAEQTPSPLTRPHLLSAVSQKPLEQIAVPTGPGLGVKLDEEKMRRYEKYFEEKGDYYARFHQDPRRPDWYPVVGGT